MNKIERLKASLRALTQQHIDLHDMWTYGASERATASELINNNTQNMNNINSQRQQLREVLWQLEEQHANLHTMYTYGPRDEVTGRIEPTEEELYPVEELIYDIEEQLMYFEFYPKDSDYLNNTEEEEEPPF